jgi:hypothetical protein
VTSDRPISLRLPHELLAEIDRRHKSTDGREREAREHGRADAIRGALGRYYEMCGRHLRALGLSRAELGIICEIVNGGLLGWGDRAAHVTAVWAEVADTIRIHPGYGRQWDLTDEQVIALARRLAELPYADVVAIVDFVELFWSDDEAANKVVGEDES